MDKLKIAEWAGKHIIYLPLYAAERAGLLAQAGIEAEFYPAGNDNNVFEELALGRADLGVGDPTFVALGAQRNVKAAVIAALVNNVCNWGFTHHEEIETIRDVRDLVTLRVGCFPKPSTTYSLLQGLKARHPVILKSMEIIEAEIGELVGLLASGKADLVVEVEPLVSLAARQGLKVVLSVADFYGEFLFTGIMATRATIESSADVLTRFISALQLALNLCNENQAQALSIAQEIFPTLPTECLRDAIGRLVSSHAWPEQAVINLGAWQGALNLRQEIGDLKRVSSPESLLHQEFAYRALTGVVR